MEIKCSFWTRHKLNPSPAKTKLTSFEKCQAALTEPLSHWAGYLVNLRPLPSKLFYSPCSRRFRASRAELKWDFMYFQCLLTPHLVSPCPGYGGGQIQTLLLYSYPSSLSLQRVESVETSDHGPQLSHTFKVSFTPNLAVMNWVNWVSKSFC